MNNTPASIIKDILTSKGLMFAHGTAWGCYLTSLPDGDLVQHNSFCMYDLPSLLEPRTFSGMAAERFHVQLRCRSYDPNAGWTRMSDVANAMDGAKNMSGTLRGVPYFVPAVRRSSVTPVGIEPGTKRRFMHTLAMDFVCFEGQAAMDLGNSLPSYQAPVNNSWNNAFQAIAATNIPSGSFVHLLANGSLVLADRELGLPAVGVVRAATMLGSEATVENNDIVNGYSGLTIGTTYFLGTLGRIDTNPGTGPILQRIGTASAADALSVSVLEHINVLTE